MAELKSTTAKSIWLIDDSGSMITYDGRRLAESPYLKDRVFFADCTRWEELTQCLRAHIKLAGALRFPSSFRVGANTFTLVQFLPNAISPRR